MLSFTAVGFLLVAFIFSLALVWAQGTESRIRALEEELAKLKGEQMESREKSASAAAALPTFSYRPGSGATIEAPDRSWSVTLSHETHFRMNFLAGRDQAGRTNGEVFGRRFRQAWTLCINNCFYEIESRLDLDGFNTNAALERGVAWLHFENFSPWLPTFYFGMDMPTRIGRYRRGSSAIGAQAESDLLSRNNGWNTGRAGTGIGINWDDKPLDMIGISGRITQFNWAMASVGEADDGVSVPTDRKDFILFVEIEPFFRIKNKWIQGLSFSVATWWCNVDDRIIANACDRLRIRDHGEGGRQTLFDTGDNVISRGLAHYISPILGWPLGPYTFRALMGFQRYQSKESAGGRPAARAAPRGSPSARNFLVAHDLFLWSPEGFLTGSATVPGSVLFGYHFERTDAACLNCGAINGGEFHRNRILLREWYLGYFIAPRANVGVHWLWYDASNLRRGRTQAQENLGVSGAGRSVAGKGGDWLDVYLDFRWSF